MIRKALDHPLQGIAYGLYRSPSAPVQAVLLSLIKSFIDRLQGISQQAVSSGFTVDLH